MAQTPEAYLNLSVNYYHQNRYAASIDAARAALALRPGYPEAWNNIGAAQNRMGDYAKGAASCEQALRLNPKFQLAQNNLDYARSMLQPTAGQKSQ
jgi:tetratricopeptide (TPR) repeat protein